MNFLSNALQFVAEQIEEFLRLPENVEDVNMVLVSQRTMTQIYQRAVIVSFISSVSFITMSILMTESLDFVFVSLKNEIMELWNSRTDSTNASTGSVVFSKSVPLMEQIRIETESESDLDDSDDDSNLDEEVGDLDEELFDPESSC